MLFAKNLFSGRKINTKIGGGSAVFRSKASFWLATALAFRYLCSLNLKEQHEKAFYRDLRLPDERGRQRSSGFGDAYGWIRDVRNLGLGGCRFPEYLFRTG